MANKDLSALTSATPASDDLAYIVQGGNSRKTTVGQIARVASGWGLYVDAATALQANAISLTAGQRTLFTVDGGTGSITTHVNGSGIQWTGNEQRGTVIGASYSTRLTFNATKSGGGGTTAYILVEQDIGDGAGPIIAAQEVALRSDSVSHPLTYNFLSYALDTFQANGARYYITPSVNITVWGKQVFVRRDY